MTVRTLTAAVLSAAGAVLIGGALASAPAGHAEPSGDAPPPCLAEGTCAVLTPATPQYLPLTPATSAR